MAKAKATAVCRSRGEVATASVQNVQAIQIVQTPSFILPRVAGEDRGEGLNVLNDLNVLNAYQTADAQAHNPNYTVINQYRSCT
jgi:hypothetical protein